MPPGTLEALATTIDLRAFFARLLFAAVLGFAAAAIYGLVFQSRGREMRFARLIPILTIAMAVIASILASSHALAIGMVGAMSWIRFRSIIDDPKNQVVILAAIALGLAAGLGAFLPGLIFLLAFGLVLFWQKNRSKLAGARITLNGNPAEVAAVLANLSGRFPALKMLSCALGSESGQWILHYPALSQLEWIDLRAFLVEHLPTAQIRIDHEG